MREKDFVNAINRIDIKESTKERICRKCQNYQPTSHSAGRLPKKIIVAACAVLLVAACSVTVFATNMFGLKDLIINSNSNSKYGNSISLQGYINSNEAKACAEWNEFLYEYDADGSILKEIGNDSTAFDEDYFCYTVYTQEMADKLNEIADKYNLKLLKSIETAYTPEDLLQLIGYGRFIKNTESMFNVIDGGYVYNEGSFHIDGRFSGEVTYQLSCYKKGNINQTYLTIGNADSYSESSYITKDGTEVNLAIGQEKTLIMLDTGDKFILVNILKGYNSITIENVKAMADTFEFSMLK